MYIYLCCHFQRKTEAQAIFLIPYSVCSLCKQKFAVCPVVCKETNGSSADRQNGLNGLNGVSHLRYYV